MQGEPGNKATHKLESMANKSHMVYAIVKVHNKLKEHSVTQNGSNYVCICTQENSDVSTCRDGWFKVGHQKAYDLLLCRRVLARG